MRMNIVLQQSMRSLMILMLVAGLLGCAAQNRPLQLLSGAGPIYPENARAAGIEGRVVVQYDVDVNGQVHNLSVVDSQPSGTFDAAALAAVRSWRFNAPLVNGVRTAALSLRSTVEFQLEGAQKYDQYE